MFFPSRSHVNLDQVVSDPISISVVYSEWLSQCCSENSYIMEDPYVAAVKIVKQTATPMHQSVVTLYP